MCTLKPLSIGLAFIINNSIRIIILEHRIIRPAFNILNVFFILDNMRILKGAGSRINNNAKSAHFLGKLFPRFTF